MPTRRDRLQRFREVMARHGPGLERVARGYAKTHHERDDLAQEVALALWKALERFRGECSERTFVYRVAHNQGLTWARRRRLEAASDGLSALDVPDQRPHPDALLDTQRRRERLYRAIADLPLMHRQALMLALEGIPHAEIAQIVGCSENTASARISRGRKLLRAALAREEA